MALWRDADEVAVYSTSVLRPAELAVLDRHREALSGRVLELGCGAGRLTGHLAGMARHVSAIDISAAMVERCHRRFPSVDATVGDLRDLSGFTDGSCDAVVAAYNVLDILDHAERRRVLREVHRVLPDGGLLVMSSHNEAYLPRNRKPTDVRARNPLRVAVNLRRMPGRVSNQRRLRRFERHEDEYSVAIDEALDFSVLHYYISPPAQVRQLATAGFETLEVLDEAGRTLEPGALAPESSEIHYVARRRPRASAR